MQMTRGYPDCRFLGSQPTRTYFNSEGNAKERYSLTLDVAVSFSAPMILSVDRIQDQMNELTYFRSVGNAVRKAVVDGFPAQQAIASDLHPGEFEFYQPNNPGVVEMMLTSFGYQNSGRWATSSLETTRKSSLRRSFQEISSTRTSWQTAWGMPILPWTYHLYKASQA